MKYWKAQAQDYEEENSLLKTQIDVLQETGAEQFAAGYQKALQDVYGDK